MRKKISYYKNPLEFLVFADYLFSNGFFVFKK